MSKIFITDEGDTSVGIQPASFTIESNVNMLDGLDYEGRKEMRERISVFFKVEFDLIGYVDVTFEGEEVEDSWDCFRNKELGDPEPCIKIAGHELDRNCPACGSQYYQCGVCSICGCGLKEARESGN